MNKLFAFISAVLIVSSIACTDKEEIQKPIDIGALNFNAVDSLVIQSKTIADESINGKNLSTVLLGETNDPRVGNNKAAFYTQLSISKNAFDIGNNAVLDSVVLILKQKAAYGKLNTAFHLSVYEMTSTLSSSESYDNNTVLNVNANKLGDFPQTNFKANTTSIRLKLDDSFGNDLLNQFGTSVMESTTNFQNYLKGIYVTATSPNGSGMVSLNLKDDVSRLELFYHNDTHSDTSFVYTINNKDVSINQYTRNINGTALNQAIANGENATEAYVVPQSTAKTILTFPDVSFLNNSIINKAEITFYQADYGSSNALNFPEQEQLFLFVNLHDTSVSFLPDFDLNNPNDFGGKKDLVEINGQNTNSYTLNITQYIQSLVNNTAKNNQLVVAGTSNNEANRIKIAGGNHPTLPIKLKILYTRKN